MFNGSFFLWAQISNYQLSYLHMENALSGSKDADVDVSSIYYVDLCLIVLNSLGFQVGAYLMNQCRVHPKL